MSSGRGEPLIDFVPTGPGEKQAAHVSSFGARIAAGEAVADVCQVGESYGPSTLGMDEGLQMDGSADPERNEATPMTVATVSSGLFSVCLTVDPPVDGRASASHMAVEYTLEERCTESPSDYTDGEATYTGVVCGLRFTYSGGVDHRSGEGMGGYTESGRFTVDPDGTATKVQEEGGHVVKCGGHREDERRRDEGTPRGP